MNAPRTRRTPPKQRGAIAVFAGLGMAGLVILLSLLDIGFMYYYKREYQKAADLAALAGAARLAQECSIDNGWVSATGNAHAIQNLGNLSYGDIDASCGTWNRTNNPPFMSPPGTDENANAVRVTVSGSAPRFLIPGTRILTARATALGENVEAALTLRSTLLNINTEQSALLDAVVGGLLGGGLEIGLISWDGLLRTDLNLLEYLDALAIVAGTGVGNYDSLLALDNLQMGDLLEAALDVLPLDGTADAEIDALGILLGLDLPSQQFSIGDLLNIAAGTGAAGLDTELNLFELVKGGAQLANGEQIINVDLPIQTGLANATIKIATKTPGQAIAIGNPSTADVAVRASNVRALVELDLDGIGSVLTLLQPIIDLLNNSGLLSDLVNVLDGSLSLDLLSTVGSLLDLVGGLLGGNACNGNCPSKNIVYAHVADPPKLTLAIDLGGGSASVEQYSCNGNPSKTLDVDAHTEAGAISIGNVDPEAFLDLTMDPPAIDPITLVEIGYKTARPRRCTCILFLCNCTSHGIEWLQPNGTTWLSGASGEETAMKTEVAGIRLSIEGESLVGQDGTILYDNHPGNPLDKILKDVGEAPVYEPLVAKDVINSVGNTLSGINVQLYSHPDFGGGVISNIFGLVVQLVDQTIPNTLSNVLSPALDPILAALLETLGVQLAQSEVGANLTCEEGSVLVE